jgi:hypothetical protein
MTSIIKLLQTDDAHHQTVTDCSDGPGYLGYDKHHQTVTDCSDGPGYLGYDKHHQTVANCSDGLQSVTV